MGKQRIQIAGGLYHITSRGNNRAPLYRDAPDYVAFERMFANVCAKLEWDCHAFCLMPNHYHVMVETPEANLAVGMQVLNLTYARWRNWRHGCSGHVFQGPYGAELITEEPHLLECYRYVALNPVRAGLCAGPADWPWTSYRATAGTEPAPPFLRVERVRGLFAWAESDGTAEFERFVHAGIVSINLAATAFSARALPRQT